MSNLPDCPYGPPVACPLRTTGGLLHALESGIAPAQTHAATVQRAQDRYGLAMLMTYQEMTLCPLVARLPLDPEVLGQLVDDLAPGRAAAIRASVCPMRAVRGDGRRAPE